MPSHPGSRPYRRAEEEVWKADELRPELLRDVYRYKTLLGTAESPVPDATMGILELSPGTYPFHEHPAPEIYYVIRGEAEWTVADETFKAREGTAVYHAPGVRHRMVNRGGEPLFAAWFWWAPGGQASILEMPSRLSSDRGRQETPEQER